MIDEAAREREAIVAWLRSEAEMRFRLSTHINSPDAKQYNHARGIAIARRNRTPRPPYKG